jgi:hypothetical protein
MTFLLEQSSTLMAGEFQVRVDKALRPKLSGNEHSIRGPIGAGTQDAASAFEKFTDPPRNCEGSGTT